VVWAAGHGPPPVSLPTRAVTAAPQLSNIGGGHAGGLNTGGAYANGVNTGGGWTNGANTGGCHTGGVNTGGGNTEGGHAGEDNTGGGSQQSPPKKQRLSPRTVSNAVGRKRPEAPASLYAAPAAAAAAQQVLFVYYTHT